MSAKNPIQVNFDARELEIINLLCHKKRISKSSFIKKIVEEWLEDYEDIFLAQRAEEAEKRAEGKLMITHEDLWKELDL